MKHSYLGLTEDPKLAESRILENEEEIERKAQEIANKVISVSQDLTAVKEKVDTIQQSSSDGTGGSVGNASTLAGQGPDFYLNRQNHTGTQPSSTISDFQSAVSANSDVSANTAARHNRQHSITSPDDHTSTATPGKLLKADSNGLPVDATNTDTEVSDAVSKTHTHPNKSLLDSYTQTDTDLADAVAKKHTQNTDQYLDYGGPNQVSAVDVKDAIDKKHNHTNKTVLDAITDAGSGAIITTAERNKLAGIEAGAEVNVQSDWAQTDSTADDYIKNKPTDLTDLSLHSVTELNDITDAGSGAIITDTERLKLSSIKGSAIEKALEKMKEMFALESSIENSITVEKTIGPTGSGADYIGFSSAALSAIAAGNIKIKILNGTYTISSQVVIGSNTIIYGESRDGVILNMQDSDNSKFTTDENSITENIVLRDFSISGSEQYFWSIYFHDRRDSNIIVRNLNFIKGGFPQAINGNNVYLVANQYNITIWLAGSYYHSIGVYSYYTTNLNMLFNVLSGPANMALRVGIQVTDYTVLYNTLDIKWNGNSSQNTGYGILILMSTDGDIRENTFRFEKTLDYDAINIQARSNWPIQRTIIENNYFFLPKNAVNFYIVNADGIISDNSISNNIFVMKGNGYTVTTSGSYSTTAQYTYNNIIVNNKIKNSLSPAINLPQDVYSVNAIYENGEQFFGFFRYYDEGYAKNNYNATAAPTANDDINSGYEVGSEWIYNGIAYKCVDATAGAAVWKQITA